MSKLGLILRLLIGNSLTSVLQIDDSAPCETVFGKRALHGKVIAVCIDLDIGTEREAIPEAEGRHAAAVRCDGNAVNDGIGLLVNPFSLVDIGVGGILPLLKIEDADRLALHLANVATALPNITRDQLLGRIGIAPLVRVAVLSHKGARALVDLHQSIEVTLSCLADRHLALPTLRLGLPASVRRRCSRDFTVGTVEGGIAAKADLLGNRGCRLALLDELLCHGDALLIYICKN